jgi:hypothetical protein
MTMSEWRRTSAIINMTSAVGVADCSSMGGPRSGPTDHGGLWCALLLRYSGYLSDEEQLNVILCFVSAMLLSIAGLRLWCLFGWRHARAGITTDAGASAAFLLDGLMHRAAPNLSHDRGPRVFLFYFLLCSCYISVACSVSAWLSFGASRRPRAVLAVNASLALCSCVIIAGASWCTIDPCWVPGRAVDGASMSGCLAGHGGRDQMQQPWPPEHLCETIVVAGEVTFQAAWVTAWLVVATALRPILHGHCEHMLSWLAAALLFAGPGQIIIVGFAPFLYTASVTATTAEVARLLDVLHTGVTYPLAVLLSFLLTGKLIERLLDRSRRIKEDCTADHAHVLVHNMRLWEGAPPVWLALRPQGVHAKLDLLGSPSLEAQAGGCGEQVANPTATPGAGHGRDHHHACDGRHSPASTT